MASAGTPDDDGGRRVWVDVLLKLGGPRGRALAGASSVAASGEGLIKLQLETKTRSIALIDYRVSELRPGIPEECREPFRRGVQLGLPNSSLVRRWTVDQFSRDWLDSSEISFASCGFLLARTVIGLDRGVDLETATRAAVGAQSDISWRQFFGKHESS